MKPGKAIFGFGAHEPIMHRLRTGNANAQEWERWNREDTEENLDKAESLFQVVRCRGF
jgi:hypothetical protein